MYVRKFDHNYWRDLPHPVSSNIGDNRIQFIWVKDRCTEKSAFTWKYIDAFGYWRGVTARCKDCYNCRLHISGKITAKSMSKFKQLKRDRVYLWTFGTSLTEGNFETLAKYWRQFTQQFAMKRKRKEILYDPLFRVFEAGSKGRRLHVHAIFGDYFDHSVGCERDENGDKIICKKSCIHAWCTWLKITGEKSNVNYVDNPIYKNAVNAFFYCAKYAVKGGSKYSYMGAMLKVPFAKYIPPSPSLKRDYTEVFKYFDEIEDQ